MSCVSTGLIHAHIMSCAAAAAAAVVGKHLVGALTNTQHENEI